MRRSLHTAFARDHVASQADRAARELDGQQHNGIPVFVDIDYDTVHIDVAQVEAAVTPKTKAVLVVHLHGLPVDMDPVLAVARKHGLKVIETPARPTARRTTDARPARWATVRPLASTRTRGSARVRAACLSPTTRTCSSGRRCSGALASSRGWRLPRVRSSCPIAASPMPRLPAMCAPRSALSTPRSMSGRSRPSWSGLRGSARIRPRSRSCSSVTVRSSACRVSSLASSACASRRPHTRFALW